MNNDILISENESKKDEDNQNLITIVNGGMWEDAFFKIAVNKKCNSRAGGEPCKHCYDIKEDTEYTSYNVWICPKVVIATNEGGYNTTGVCLDCILEAAKENNLINL